VASAAKDELAPVLSVESRQRDGAVRWNVRFDREKNIAHLKLKGLLSEETVLAAFDAVVTASEYEPGMCRLWDCTDADLSDLNAAVFERVRRHSAELPPGVRDVKVAVLVGNLLDFGLARMYGLSPGPAATTVRLFHDPEEAEAWLTSTSTG
jgi:hypothetical protein